MSRTREDIIRMTGEDTAVGLVAHYKPLAEFINQRGYKRGIEIGTAYGGCANHLLSNCDLELLICIDPYKYYPDMPGLFDQDDYDKVRESARKRLEKFNQVIFQHSTSEEAFYRLNMLRPVTDSGIDYDFVFIDGLHEYETIKWECDHYQNLLKEGGALMGHDYNIFEDVNKAVDEFAKGKELNLLPGNIWYINY